MGRRAVVALCVAGLAGILLAGVAHANGQFLANGLLPPVPIPPDNPSTDAKVELGRQLYFEKRMSLDNTISCASCHDPKVGWADPRPVSEGVGGGKGTRNAPTVLNSAYNRVQFWDGRAPDLEHQALGPLQNPVEMKMTMPMVVDRLKSLKGYTSQFQAVFGTEPNDDGVAKAIAAFERTVVSTDSPYDKYLRGDKSAMTPAAVRGMNLFRGKAHCMSCHSGPNFTDDRFHNLGIGYKDDKFADVGRFSETKRVEDTGAFKTPTLRSVAETAPYLHDGSEKTLEDVVDLYNRGGVRNPYLDRLMMPLHLTACEKSDLVEFLKALTGAPLDITEPALPQ
jgi:cytochrome c peroxidase